MTNICCSIQQLIYQCEAIFLGKQEVVNLLYLMIISLFENLGQFIWMMLFKMNFDLMWIKFEDIWSFSSVLVITRLLILKLLDVSGHNAFHSI